MQIYLTVVIPAYDEQHRIKPTLKEIIKYLSDKEFSSEIIVVDDGSSDKTNQISKEVLRKFPSHKVLKLSPNQGKGAAIKTGVSHAQGKYILFMDADNSTHIQQIENLLPYIEEYPIVIGSRHISKESIKRKQSFIRRILSRTSNFLIRRMLRTRILDTQCGFKLFQGSVAKNIFDKVEIKRFGFDIEIIAITLAQEIPIKEVPVNWYDAGRSKLRAGQAAFATLIELLKIRRNLRRGVYDKN